MFFLPDFACFWAPLYYLIFRTFKWGALPLVENEMNQGFTYELDVYTGFGRKAGTFSRVYFVLGGENATAPTRELDDGKRNVSKSKSAILCFLDF